MKCSICQADSPADSAFCVECGAKLVPQCPKCGQLLEPRFKFCNKCGHDLSKLVNIPAPSHLPPASSVAVSPSAPTATPEGDRRQATVLFSDLSGYTAMNERLDPEEVAGIMARIKSEAVKIVESHDGIVNQFVGDEVLALFGIPTAHQDDPVRAVRAALALHEMIREMSPELEPRLNRTLRLHTGINTGLIVTGHRDDRDGRIGVTGDTINTGARLRSLAEEDAIVLGPETRRLVSDEFETEPLDPVALKGKAGQITPHRLVRERAIPVRASLPCIGRRAETRQFTGIVEECLESGRGQAVYVRSDVGIGKSRLVEEFETIATGRGFSCHKAVVLDFGMAKGHDAIRSVVSSVLNVQMGASEDDRREALDRAISDRIVDESQLLFLNDLLDLPPQSELRLIYEAMDNETRNRGKRETVGEVVKRTSAVNPIMVVIENIQWADGVTLAHLASLSAIVAEARALLIMTSRLEGDPLDQAWRAASRDCPLSTIDLAPLRAVEALELARQFASVKEEVAQHCIEQAAGNPLFLVQLLRSADESFEEGIPGSVQSVVLARVDRLPAHERQAIQAASIFGQQYSLAALRALLGTPDYRCDYLVGHLLLRPEGENYQFTHALIQEVVYGSLLIARRAELHRRAADWFATRDLPLRAEHLERATDPTAAQAFLEAAQDQAAALRYERALALAKRGLALKAEPAIRFGLMCFAGELHRKLGHNPESIESYGEAERLAVDDIQRCRAWIGQVEGLRLTDRYQDALALLVKTEKAATENRLAAECSQLHYLRANIYFPLGDLTGCQREHGMALAWAREAGIPEAEARSLGGLGDAYYLGGRIRTANDSFRRCIDLCREHGLSQVEVANLPMVGWTGIYTGALRHALENGKAAIDIARKVSHYRAESQARSLVGFIEMEMGDFADAREQMTLALALSRKLKARRFEAHFLCDLARLAHAEGNRSDAFEPIEQALSICRDVGMNYIGPAVLGCHALIDENSGNRKRAFDEAEEILRKGCVSHNYLWFYRDAIEVCLDSGDWDAVEHYATALEDYTRQEPLPWSDFFIARGRNLATYRRGQRSDALHAKLGELSAVAHRLELTIAARALENALHEA